MYFFISLCTKVVAQQSDKRGKSTNKSTLLKIITTKLLLKDENGKVIADKKIRRFNS
jgi:hypothetical protein